MSIDQFVEEIQVLGRDLVEKVKALVHEGNVNRIIIKDEKGNTFVEIPVTVATLGAIFAPVLAAVGALSALAAKFKIVIERKPTFGPRAQAGLAQRLLIARSRAALNRHRRRPQMHAQRTAAALREHLEIAARLRRFDYAKSIFLAGHREIGGIIACDLQEHAAVRPALVRLAGRMEKAWPKSEASSHAFGITHGMPNFCNDSRAPHSFQCTPASRNNRLRQGGSDGLSGSPPASFLPSSSKLQCFWSLRTA